MRHIAELDAAAKALNPGEPIVITSEEAGLVVSMTQQARTASGKLAPTRAYLMEKCTSGKARIHGHAIEVRD